MSAVDEGQGGWLERGGGFLLADGPPEQVLTPEAARAVAGPVADVAAEFVRREVLPRAPRLLEHDGAAARELLRQAGELGLLGLEVEEAYGGSGLGPVAAATVTEAMGWSGDFAVTFGAHSGIGTLPIALFGTPDQKLRYLPDLVAGRRVAAYALTEPMAGSDALSVRTTASAVEGGFALTGQKQWITNAGFADVFVVYAKVGGERFTAFIVDRDTPGLSLGPEEDKLGIRGSSTRAVYLDGAFVPAANVLGEVGRGHVIAFNVLNVGRLKLACGTVGSSKAALATAARYAAERRQFGRPIADFGLIQEKLAAMATRIYALESMVYRTAGLVEARRRAEADPATAIGELAVECSIAKVYGSEALGYVVDEALQIHGGYGFMNDYPVSRMYRDARINRIFEGTNEINRLLAVDALMRRALRGALPLLPAMRQAREASPPPQAPWPVRARHAVLLVASLAVERFETRLEEQQEVVARLADMLAALFAAQSAWWRAHQAGATPGEGAGSGAVADPVGLHGALATLVAEESRRAIRQAGEEVLRACGPGPWGEPSDWLARLDALVAPTAVDAIALRRRVAAKVREAGGYPLGPAGWVSAG